MVAVGVAQEFQYVTSAVKVDGEPGAVPRLAFGKAERRVTCFYFYLWDEEFGPAFIKICAYFPYPVKVWVNGHEWAKRQATWAGIGFTELSNGFATCDAPDRLQWLCDQLTPERIGRFVHEWLTDLVVTVLYLLRLRHDASDQPAGLGVALPPAARLAARPHAIAFPVWTFAIVSGAMWAESAWGRYWAGIRRRPGPSSVGCSTPRTCTPDIGLAARPHRRPTRLRRLGQHADQPLRSTC